MNNQGMAAPHPMKHGVNNGGEREMNPNWRVPGKGVPNTNDNNNNNNIIIIIKNNITMTIVLVIMEPMGWTTR